PRRERYATEGVDGERLAPGRLHAAVHGPCTHGMLARVVDLAERQVGLTEKHEAARLRLAKPDAGTRRDGVLEQRDGVIGRPHLEMRVSLEPLRPRHADGVARGVEAALTRFQR